MSSTVFYWTTRPTIPSRNSTTNSTTKRPKPEQVTSGNSTTFTVISGFIVILTLVFLSLLYTLTRSRTHNDLMTRRKSRLKFERELKYSPEEEAYLNQEYPEFGQFVPNQVLVTEAIDPRKYRNQFETQSTFDQQPVSKPIRGTTMVELFSASTADTSSPMTRVKSIKSRDQRRSVDKPGNVVVVTSDHGHKSASLPENYSAQDLSNSSLGHPQTLLSLGSDTVINHGKKSKKSRRKSKSKKKQMVKSIPLVSDVIPINSNSKSKTNSVKSIGQSLSLTKIKGGNTVLITSKSKPKALPPRGSWRKTKSGLN